MLAACSIDDVKCGLSRVFGENNKTVRLVCILFAPPGSKITKDEILPRWDDFHHRSGAIVDFFCAGYGAYWPKAMVDDQESVAVTTDKMGNRFEWLYSSILFDQFVREAMNYVPSWHYGGEVELLMFDAYKTESLPRLDFSSLIRLDISSMKEDKAIQSCAGLFETIIQFKPPDSGQSPASLYSDRMGLTIGKKWIEELFTFLLPGKLDVAWKRGRHYAVLSTNHPTTGLTRPPAV